MIGAALLLATAAEAHPLAGRVVTHQVSMLVTEDRVAVGYVASVPLGAPHPHAEAEATGFATPDDLATGLVLEVDGAFVPLALDPEDPPAVGGRGDQMVTRLVVAAPLPAGTHHQIELSNHNYPDLLGYFSNEVRVGTAVEVLEGSLIDVEGGRVTRDWNGGWLAGDPHRAFDVEVRIRDGALDRLARRAAESTGAVRSSADAVPPGPVRAWGRRDVTPGVLGGLGLLAAAAGGIGGAWPQAPRARVAALAAGALVGVALAVLPSAADHAAFDSLAGGVAVGLGVLALRGQAIPWALGAGAAAVLAAAHTSTAALALLAVVVVGHAAGFLASYAPHARMVGATTLGIGAAVILRGLLPLLAP